MSAISTPLRTETFGQRLLRLGRRLVPREGVLTLVLLVFVMLSGVWAVEAAGWVDQLPSLGLILVLATAMGLLFAKLHLPWFIVHPVSVLYGLYVTVWQVTGLIDKPELHERIVDLIIRLNAWGYAARTGGANTDPLVFVFMLASLTWLIGYFSTYFVFRLHHIWLGILPTAVALLMNLRYAPAQATVWFFFFLAFSLLLLVRYNVFRQHQQWRKTHVDFSPSVGYASLPELTLYSVLIALFVWLTPSGGVAPVISDAWNNITAPYNDFAIEFNRLFANLNTTASEGPSTTFSRALVLKGAIKLSNSILMYVQADQPVYLRATVYDVYNGKGMVTGEKNTVSFPPGNEVPQPTQEYKSRKEMTQKIALRATPGNAILAAGVPLRASQRAVAEVDKPVSYFLSLDDASTDSSLPTLLRPNAQTIRDAFVKLRSDNKLGQTPADLPADAATGLPADVKLVSYLLRDNRISGLELQFVNLFPTDFTSVRVPGRGRAPAQYQVVSSISDASEAELRTAGTTYPGWITERYLQLPSAVPESVQRLAHQLTDDAANPYDKAMRLQDYLRTFQYNEQISAPPPGVDPVEYFLFTMRQGYCDYFSTSMVVMLRSLGIPARVSAGYFTGEFDANKGYYLVRESNTHAWPEVFFPEYGWIEFEPTPSRPPIARGAGATAQDPTVSGPSTPSNDPLLDDPLLLEDDFGISPAGTTTQETSVPVFPIAAVVLVLASGGAAWYLWRRSMRGLVAAPLVYEKVCRLAALAFRPQRPAETPLEYGYALGDELPGRARLVNRVMQGYTAARYSRGGANVTEMVRLRRAWEELRGSLLWMAFTRPFRKLSAALTHRRR